jgi:hypothetical protein
VLFSEERGNAQNVATVYNEDEVFILEKSRTIQGWQAYGLQCNAIKDDGVTGIKIVLLDGFRIGSK